MTIDFQLAWACTHETLGERVKLNSDLVSFTFAQPISSSQSLRLMYNDLDVPQVGLKSFGQLYTSKAGPFDILESALNIETSAGSITINFKGSKRYSASELSKYIIKSGFKGTIEVVNEHLCFTDTNKIGSGSYIKTSGSALTYLGLEHQKGANGRDLLPSWYYEGLSKIPKFTEPVDMNGIWKASYITYPDQCLRCRGTYVENDLRVDSTGQPYFVDDSDLLYQASLKILLTQQGSNPFQSWYGTQIHSKIGTKALAATASFITEDIRRSLVQFQKLQRDQAKYQVVTSKEQLYSILDVSVRPHAQNPSTFLVDVTIQNASREPINLSVVFTVPSVVALMGSNGLYLGLEKSGLSSTDRLF